MTINFVQSSLKLPTGKPPTLPLNALVVSTKVSGVARGYTHAHSIQGSHLLSDRLRVRVVGESLLELVQVPPVVADVRFDLVGIDLAEVAVDPGSVCAARKKERVLKPVCLSVFTPKWPQRLR